MAVDAERSEFATALREWRRRRRVSQLELALDAGTTQRHVSFIESDRSVPGREMVVRLAEALDVPLRERNSLLLGAGYAPAYDEAELDDPRLDRRYPTGPLDAILAELEQVVPERGRPDPNHLGYAVPLRLRSPSGELTLLTTLAHFATAIEVTVSELSLEAFLPGDAKTAEALAVADRRRPG
jgi:transcriptional regulator with XRE-family HTH domain